MIEKVLIAEDHESASISIQKSLDDLKIPLTDYAYYCDDALDKIITSIKLGHSYDLLITDLYFEDDGRPQKITNGIELIKTARNIQPELKVLVFSAENKVAIIDDLYTQIEIDGFVRKARHDSTELKKAIEELSKNRKYLPRHITHSIHQKNTYNFSSVEIEIITLLASGVAQKDIPNHLKQKKITPSGLSSIEKKLNHIKRELDITKNEQLIAFCKDMGII